MHQASGDSIVLEGRTHAEWARIEAKHTHGSFGHGNCEVDDSVKSPQFRVECPVDPNRPATHVDISIYRPDRALGELVLTNAFWRESAESRTYRPTETSRAVMSAYSQVFGGDASPAGASGSASGDSTSEGGSTDKSTDAGAESREAASIDERKFVELVNAVRERANLEPFAIEEAQTQTARGIADRYFRARFVDRDPETAEQIALGLIAGWDVRASIASGSFASRAVQSARPEVLVEWMLETPSGRAILLGEEFERVAVGLAAPEKGGSLGALVAAYHELPDQPPGERAQKAVETINEAREDAGSAPIEREHSLNTKIAELARKIESEQLGLQQAQRQLIIAASRHWDRKVRLDILVARTLDRMKIPERLLTAPLESAAVMVAPFRPEGAAWTSYVIFLVRPAPKGTMARRPEPSRRAPRDSRASRDSVYEESATGRAARGTGVRKSPSRAISEAFFWRGSRGSFGGFAP